MLRRLPVVLGIAGVMAAASGAAAAPPVVDQVRLQQVGRTYYFVLRVNEPADMRLPPGV